MDVVVAIYEHRHGNDVAVFSTMEKAWAWAEEIAREYWGRIDPEERPAEFDAEFYWDYMNGYECFSMCWREVL
jgi:hypothetical protein